MLFNLGGKCACGEEAVTHEDEENNPGGPPRCARCYERAIRESVAEPVEGAARKRVHHLSRAEFELPDHEPLDQALLTVGRYETEPDDTGDLDELA